MEICRLENVSKTYLMGEKVRPLQNVNLVVNSGDFISIEGPSGIGKSTLLYVMGSLLKQDEGKLYLAGQDTSLLTDRRLTTIRAEKIGLIFQEANLIEALTLQENLVFAQSLGKKSKNDSQELATLLERLGLADRKDFLPHQLSGGQRRRAMVARALINYPLLILADEPTNDLDDVWAKVILQLFVEAIHKGCAVVMVTHNHRWAADATVRYRMEHGKLALLDK
ncbi:MAG: ABC transporter ATP-binding protein [Syntrophomonadaceae bacterium]|nr:ABC transporter ATP-binding protein [Syntrophomonadaceae bacterium]